MHDTIQQNENMSEHQKTVLTDALDNLLPLLKKDRSPSYIRDAWKSGSGAICVSIEEIRPAQFQHYDLSNIPGLQSVQPSDRKFNITFEDHGIEYKIFMYEKREDEDQ